MNINNLKHDIDSLKKATLHDIPSQISNYYDQKGINLDDIYVSYKSSGQSKDYFSSQKDSFIDHWNIQKVSQAQIDQYIAQGVPDAYDMDHERFATKYLNPLS